MKFFKYFEFAYIAFAIFFIIEALRIWADSEGRAYMYLFFSVLAVFMFFFKRRFRKKIDQKNKR
jgi:hypothetical protein